MTPKSEMTTKNVYTSIGCNRTTEAADWGNNGLVIFAACNAVAILNPKYDGNSAKILQTYVQHTKRVNAVKWLRNSAIKKEIHFISGGDDGVAIFWNIEDINQPQHYRLIGHESGITVVAGLYRNSTNEYLLGTASADSSIKLWLFNGVDQPSIFQTINLNNGFCFALQLTFLPKKEQVLLAFSSDDETISLWSQYTKKDSVANEFSSVHKLKGHEDWVRGLDIIDDGNDLLLASSSQDHFIRLWRLSERTDKQVLDNSIDLLSIDDIDLRVEEKITQVGENLWYAFSLESVLFGHDGWVYSVNWHKTDKGLYLLSASMDKTLIVWEAREDGIWNEKIRLGDVGGNSLGFYGGKFSNDGQSILGHSYTGGFHIWTQSEENEDIWFSNVATGGHFGEVCDLAWEPKGAYLMTVSTDQTTRIHAPWLRPKQKADKITWHELARTQVHGYNMQALAILSRYKFASGAEEKIVRTFQASSNFIENFKHIALENSTEDDEILKSLPKGASVPSLGLSNEAVYDVEEEIPKHNRNAKSEYPENYFVPVTLEAPPHEETLMQNTLWPEVQKLYGHGYEIYALASSPDGKILASTCRASNAEHAQIILWNTTTWKQIQKLASHNLTVTQLRFSPNGRYLLSVSRDRRWSLFQQEQEKGENASWNLVIAVDKTNSLHTRIIWACDWSHDSKNFVTTSRDGKAIIWKESPKESNKLNDWHAWEVLELKNESITAVAFAQNSLKCGAFLIALGLESGQIKIYKFNNTWTLLLSLNNDQSHHLTVKRLQFRPISTYAEENNFYLASCGEDHLVRIYEITV